MATKPPKKIAGWPPQHLTPVPKADLDRSRGDKVVDFGEALCRIVKDSVAGAAGDPMVFRPWQKELLRHVFAVTADGKLRHRRALILLPRKQGKSAVLSAVALDQLVFGVPGGEIYSCAADREQARIVFDTAKRMVEMEPELSDSLKVFRDSIYNPATGSVYKVLSSEAATKEGYSPSFVCFDEVHAQPNRELWDVMSLGMGARNEPMIFAISTAGVKTDSTGKDSICYSLYQYGKRVASGEVDDPTFFMAAWEAPADADYLSEDTWRQANPGFDDILSAADMRSAAKSTPEAEFKTKRLDMWVSTSDAWLPAGSFEAIAKPEKKIPEGSDIILAFDGSLNGDCTVIMGCSVEDIHHLEVMACWEKPEDADASWQVPVMQVEDKIRELSKVYNVVEICCDLHRWVRSFQILDEEGFPVVEYPQTPARMTPATARMYEAIMNKTVTHSGDPQLARHFANATLRTDQRGSRLSKDRKGSVRRIDLAVASVMALDRAAFWLSQGNFISPLFDPWKEETV